jgi:hypothetical protein
VGHVSMRRGPDTMILGSYHRPKSWLMQSTSGLIGSPYVRPEKTLKMGPKSAIKFPFKEGSHSGEMLQSLSLIAQNAFLLFIGQNLLVLKAPTTSPICWTPPRQTKKLDPSFSRPQIRYSSAVHIGELPGSYRDWSQRVSQKEVPLSFKISRILLLSNWPLESLLPSQMCPFVVDD